MERLKERVKQSFIDNPVILMLCAMVVVLIATVPSFLSWGNIVNIMKQISPTMIVAMGVTFVFISNAKDLSAASNMAFAAVVANLVMMRIGGTMGTVFGLFAAVLVGLLFGTINGFLVAKLQINPFIATLVTSLIFEGVGLVVTDAQTLSYMPKWLLMIARTNILGLPAMMVFVIVVYLIGSYVLGHTGFGRCLYAVGTSRDAAFLSGVNPVKYKMIAYWICGVCASVGGMMLSIRLGAASQGMTKTVMLDIISAVLIGGASMSGGKGSLLGTAFGVVALGLLSNGLDLLNVEYNVLTIIKGFIILIAVVMDAFKERTSDRRLIRLIKQERAPAARKT
ncbi:ABC transporter permease [Feifania hominis]|uniref:ABC transporter permease n=1 Tax=Feifania hominis TaxID=2763660 RepID=A0A926HUI8_9FIRM|nr:ABC transporter permease [Feifania hominis]MBC8536959.1 ABC transporter permease [Feifania hominis]